MSSKTKALEPKKEPVARFSSGAISVSIWERQGSNGAFYSANVQRCYKTDGDEWAYSDSFGRDELPIASRLMDMAFAWISHSESKQRTEAQR